MQTNNIHATTYAGIAIGWEDGDGFRLHLWLECRVTEEGEYIPKEPFRVAHNLRGLSRYQRTIYKNPPALPDGSRPRFSQTTHLNADAKRWKETVEHVLHVAKRDGLVEKAKAEAKAKVEADRKEEAERRASVARAALLELAAESNHPDLLAREFEQLGTESLERLFLAFRKV